jgi:hypothetical protein
MNNTPNENELTNAQRTAAVWRTIGSFRVLFGAVFFAVIGGLIAPPLMYVAGIGYYVLMASAAWKSGTSPADKEKK